VSDWSSDVCSSDLLQSLAGLPPGADPNTRLTLLRQALTRQLGADPLAVDPAAEAERRFGKRLELLGERLRAAFGRVVFQVGGAVGPAPARGGQGPPRAPPSPTSMC